MSAAADAVTGGLAEYSAAPARGVRVRTAWMAVSIPARFVSLLLLVYVAKQLLMVVLFPPFSGHDEVAHYAYIQSLAADHHVPRVVNLERFRDSVIAGGSPQGDFLPNDLYPYCRYVLDWYCDPDSVRWRNSPPHTVTVLGAFYPSGWQYVANHPPLYYAVMTPIYWLSDGASAATQQYLLRAAAIPFGVLIVLLAFWTVATVFPGESFLAITVPTFVAFQPQISYEAAMVNNDILGILAISLIVYLLMRGLRRAFTWRLCLCVGLALGFGLLAKSTTVIALPVIAVAVIAGTGLRRVGHWLPRGLTIAAVGAAIAAPWYYFLYRTYGNLSALDQIAENQWGWTYRGRVAPSMLDQLFNTNFAFMRWRETWGEFGWRLIRLDNALLLAIGIPCAIAVIGLIYYVVKNGFLWRRPSPQTDPIWRPDAVQVRSLLVLALAALVAYAGVLQFGTRFQLTQARYFFPAINAIALLLMLGFRALIPRSALRYGQAILFSAMIALNLVIYTQYVVPFWHLAS